MTYGIKWSLLRDIVNWCPELWRNPDRSSFPKKSTTAAGQMKSIKTFFFSFFLNSKISERKKKWESTRRRYLHKFGRIPPESLCGTNHLYRRGFSSGCRIDEFHVCVCGFALGCWHAAKSEWNTCHRVRFVKCEKDELRWSRQFDQVRTQGHPHARQRWPQLGRMWHVDFLSIRTQSGR